VIAVKRSYMRGCGTAVGAATGKGSGAGKLRSDAEVKAEAMGRCALSQEELKEGDVRVDPYGRLYSAKAAVEELIRLREAGEASDWVVKGSKDLKELAWSKDLCCYLTNTPLLSGVVPCSVILSGPNKGKCVTASALKEMGSEIVEGETMKLLQNEEEREATDVRLREERERKERKKRKKEAKEGKGDEGGERKKKKAKPAGAPAARPLVASATTTTSSAASSIFHSSASVAKQDANDLFACSGGRRF